MNNTDRHFRGLIGDLRALLVSVIALTSVVPAFSTQTKPLPETLHYKLDIRIDFRIDKLYASCEITVANNTDQPIEQIPILLYRLLTVKSVKNEHNRSLQFSQNVVGVSGWEKLQVNSIEISLSRVLLPGEQRRLKLEYEGYLLGYSEAGWRYVKDHIDKKFTIIRTDGLGYPVLGLPNERDMLAIVKERYDYLIDLTVPRGMMAVTGGELIDHAETDSTTTFVFRSKKPSWRLDIAISDYRLLETGKNGICYFPNDSSGAQAIMDALESSLRLYSSWFGPLDNYQGVTIIEVPEGYGSQEDITSLIITEDSFQKPEDMHTIYHETSHLWNVKHLDPQPCRFESEGLAQFLQFLVSEKLDREKNAVSGAAQRYIDRLRTTFNEKQEFQQIPIKDYGLHDMTDYSYTLGMVVYAILYDLVGEDHFNEMIGSFYSAYYSKGATLDEFIHHCIESAPVDLETFFDDWIYSTKGIKLVVDGKTFTELVRYYKGK